MDAPTVVVVVVIHSIMMKITIMDTIILIQIHPVINTIVIMQQLHQSMQAIVTTPIPIIITLLQITVIQIQLELIAIIQAIIIGK